MNSPAQQKICRWCNQDCSQRPRTRDPNGRYFCQGCYEEAIARKHQKRGMAAPAPFRSEPARTPVTNGHAASHQRTPSAAPITWRDEPRLSSSSTDQHAPHEAISPDATVADDAAALPLHPPLPSWSNRHQTPVQPLHAPDLPGDSEPIHRPTPQPVPPAFSPNQHESESPAARIAPVVESNIVHSPSLPLSIEPIGSPVDPTVVEPASASDSINLELGAGEQSAKSNSASPIMEAVITDAAPIAARKHWPASTFELEPEISAAPPPASTAAPADPNAALNECVDRAIEPIAQVTSPEAAVFERIAAPAPVAPATLLEAAAMLPSLPEIDLNDDTSAVQPVESPSAVPFTDPIIRHHVPTQVHRTPQAMLMEDGPPAAAFAGCPHCHHPMAGGAIVCLHCGFNLMSGEIAPESIQRVIKRRPPRAGWVGPILTGMALSSAAIAGGVLLYGQQMGFLVFALAFLVAMPAWFLWSLIDARDTEGAQLKIWIVPGYIFAYVFGESRSRWLRAITAGVVAIIVMFAAHVYEWNRQAQERERAAHRAIDP